MLKYLNLKEFSLFNFCHWSTATKNKRKLYRGKNCSQKNSQMYDTSHLLHWPYAYSSIIFCSPIGTVTRVADSVLFSIKWLFMRTSVTTHGTLYNWYIFNCIFYLKADTFSRADSVTMADNSRYSFSIARTKYESESTLYVTTTKPRLPLSAQERVALYHLDYQSRTSQRETL